MIEAHSAFFSMSPTDAFWTLRILPRIGSSAWNSELRASLAVPSAESPSTMNSSLRSMSLERQSASLAGSALDSRAFLRRWVSRCWRAAIRVREALATFSRTSLACAFSARLVEVRNFFSSRGRRPCVTIGARGGRAEHLLGLALELRLGQPHGDDRGQPLEHVVLDDVGLVGLERPWAAQHLVERLGHAPRSKPATWVPPLGVAITLTKERSSVS